MRTMRCRWWTCPALLLAVVTPCLRAQPTEQDVPEPVRGLIAQVRGTSAPDRLAALLKLRELGATAAAAVPAVAALLYGAEAEAVAVDLPPHRLHWAEVAASTLAKLGNAALGPLTLATTSDSETARQASCRALREANADWPRDPAARAVLPQLIERLAQTDPAVRRATARTLGQLGDDRALPALAALSADAAAAVDLRLAAVRALTALPSADVPAKLEAVLDDREPALRLAAVEALADRRPAPAEPLLHALADSDVAVRAAAVSGLRYAQDPRVLPAIIARLGDEGQRVREVAAMALGQLHDALAVEPLLALLADPSRSVREEAIYALARLADKRAVPKLIELTRDGDPRLRELAARALARFKDPAVLPALVALLADTPDVIDAAASSLKILTGQKLGRDKAAWEAWLATRK